MKLNNQQVKAIAETVREQLVEKAQWAYETFIEKKVQNAETHLDHHKEALNFFYNANPLIREIKIDRHALGVPTTYQDIFIDYREIEITKDTTFEDIKEYVIRRIKNNNHDRTEFFKNLPSIETLCNTIVLERIQKDDFNVYELIESITERYI